MLENGLNQEQVEEVLDRMKTSSEVNREMCQYVCDGCKKSFTIMDMSYVGPVARNGQHCHPSMTFEYWCYDCDPEIGKRQITIHAVKEPNLRETSLDKKTTDETEEYF